MTQHSWSLKRVIHMRDMAETFAHIPTPGDHYSPATGSAIPTVIYELSRWHEHYDGRTLVIVQTGTRHDYAIGECIEYPIVPRLSRNKKIVDSALGRIGLPRRHTSSIYHEVVSVIPKSFAGKVFLHNSPGATAALRQEHKLAFVCLWLQNQVFRTFSRTEVHRIASSVDRFICCSDYIARDLHMRLRTSRDKIKVVHNGVDVERFSPRSFSGADETVPTVLFVGRVVPQKGPDLLLKAACRIYKKKRPFKVRIVGSSGFDVRDPLSPYERELRRIAAPLHDVVEFRPFVDRTAILQEFRNASIFCTPSNWDDPCPLTVLEGMACGLPTVASRRGGIPEEGGTSLLYFDPPNVPQLAELLMYLLEDERARQEWGYRARVRALEMSWKNQYLRLRDAIAAS